MTIKGDRLICFSSGFQNITQLDKSFHLVYNMMGIGYQMVTWPYGYYHLVNTMFGIARLQIEWE